jgi:hypothetical protein
MPQLRLATVPPTRVLQPNEQEVHIPPKKNCEDVIDLLGF